MLVCSGLEEWLAGFDVIIVGGGIVGLTLARELMSQKKLSIAVFEKESEAGKHASGRNSGVLHAGIYYGTDSLKAKVCAEGARRMREYCLERDLPYLKTGKVIVATSEETAPQIDVLYKRARANGIAIEKLDAQQLKEHEPEAVSCGPALFSPNTAVIDSKKILKSLVNELIQNGVTLFFQDKLLKVDPAKQRVTTTSGHYSYGHLINAAGTYADSIAHSMGVGQKYRVLPFKGIYWKLSEGAASRILGSIYPAPDLSLPFLGVHLTRGVDGSVMAGPTAMPALGRENYGGLSGLSARDMPRMAWDLSRMYLRNTGGFRRLVSEELGRYRHAGFLHAVQQLTPFISSEDILNEGKVGVRAQLVNKETLSLEMDFRVESGPNSTHILNAISPAFTSSFAFAEFVVKQIFENRSAGLL